MPSFQEKIPVVESTQAARELEEGSVLVVDCKQSHYRLLNGSGSFLWKQINGELSVNQLATRLSEEFEIDQETALRDTEAFLMEMEKRSIVSWQK